jgi:hypothetical protein
MFSAGSRLFVCLIIFVEFECIALPNTDDTNTEGLSTTVEVIPTIEGGDRISSLPIEVQGLILEKCDPTSLRNCASVKKRWKTLSEDTRYRKYRTRSPGYIRRDFFQNQFVPVKAGKYWMASGPISLSYKRWRGGTTDTYVYSHVQTPMAVITRDFEVQKTPLTRCQYRALLLNQGCKPDPKIPNSYLDGGIQDRMSRDEFNRVLVFLNSVDTSYEYAFITEVQWEYVAKESVEAQVSTVDRPLQELNLRSTLEEISSSNQVWFFSDPGWETFELMQDYFSEHYPLKHDEKALRVYDPRGPAQGMDFVIRGVNRRKELIKRSLFYWNNGGGGTKVGMRLVRYKK